MKNNVSEVERETKCPECGSTNLIGDHERAEIVCGDCGLVIDDNIVDMGPEWRAFDHEQRDKRTRVGAPITYTIHDKGLSKSNYALYKDPGHEGGTTKGLSLLCLPTCVPECLLLLREWPFQFHPQRGPFL